MKKLLSVLLATLMIISLAACTPANPTDPVDTVDGDPPVASMATEYVVDGSSGWTVQTINIKIAADEDVLYDGTVLLTSDDQFVSEVTYAAITEAGIGQDGVLAGFVNSIGDYVNGEDADGNYLFWGYTVNGKSVPLACNQMRVLDGDTIVWQFQVYDESAGFGTGEGTKIDPPFEVGTDATEYAVDGASGWTVETLNIKIVAGEDVLYNGTVLLTSDNILVSEATYAAIAEVGIGQDGVLAGFVNSIGDYVSGENAEGDYMYWGYTVNGKYVPFGCDQMTVLDGDYILWEFQAYAE